MSVQIQHIKIAQSVLQHQDIYRIISVKHGMTVIKEHVIIS